MDFAPNPPPKKEFADKLLGWFAAAMRPLPWRGAYDPYGVWISEVMLQQTQAERGARYFREWMRLFPDIRSVAEASEEAVLAAWEGLGYYSRARNIQAAARRIMRDHGGEFPRSVDAIRALPGVGDYTAGAVAAIAFNLPEPAVDANVMRIFARICDIALPMEAKGVKAAITDMTRALIPAESPRMFCQALMELGALVCGKVPKCGDCPVRDYCEALRAGTVAERPVKKGKTSYRVLEMAAAIITRGDRVFIQKRPPDGLWAGLWEFPCGGLRPGESPEEAAIRHVLEATGLSATVRAKIATVRHGYTTNRVIMHGFFCEVPDNSGSVNCSAAESLWVSRAKLNKYAFPAGHRKLLEKLGWK